MARKPTQMFSEFPDLIILDLEKENDELTEVIEELTNTVNTLTEKIDSFKPGIEAADQMYQNYGAGHLSPDDCTYCPVAYNEEIEKLTSSLYENFGRSKSKRKSKRKRKSKKSKTKRKLKRKSKKNKLKRR